MSIRDVAAAAGVSVATVSRALGPNADSEQIRPETRQRVLETSAALGYRPNDLARALLHRRTLEIAVVVPDISNPYYPGLVRGIEDAASAAGYRVVLCNTDRDPAKTDLYLDALVKSRVDGVVIAGGAADTSIDPRVLRQYRTKTVLVGRHALDHPSVQVDNVGAASALVEHIVGLGHQRVAFLAGPLSSHTVQDRLKGYRETLTRHGLVADDALVVSHDLDEESGYRGARELLLADPAPTAIVAANDRTAVGVLAALADMRIPVPGQVSVAGFDDVSIASYLRPALTTVAIPTHEIGRNAARLLFDQLATSAAELATEQPRHVLLPTRLVIRDSCASPLAG